jgi:MYXO-CTERM domain-containing protein
VKIGGGTDPKTDPLLTISLEKFAIDFYVFHSDRFVRIFTYTADVAIPVSLQTGKDPKTNPNGGILPVLGDLKITNGAVTNADNLLFEDPITLSAAVTGLFGSVIGQFLGNGFSPIDLSSALASAGLTMDIPAGGIRKLTSGSDDFIGIFANLAAAPGAASEEADTRASILEKIVDPNAMGLTTADRARSPKLRVAVDGIASKPTEHTWWIDSGTHAAWTTSKELLVDSDAMLLQGKHVLHVSARIVGVTASEDETPVELPFTIDTLPPRVEATRDGGDVRLSTWDFVSKNDALLMRWREGDAPFGEWRSYADTFAADPSRTVDLEVKDEEGNVASVALPLRGRADSTLAAAGSGCGCRTAPADSRRDAALFAGALAALGLLVSRRRRAA